MRNPSTVLFLSCFSRIGAKVTSGEFRRTAVVDAERPTQAHGHNGEGQRTARRGKVMTNRSTQRRARKKSWTRTLGTSRRSCRSLTRRRTKVRFLVSFFFLFFEIGETQGSSCFSRAHKKLTCSFGEVYTNPICPTCLHFEPKIRNCVWTILAKLKTLSHTGGWNDWLHARSQCFILVAATSTNMWHVFAYATVWGSEIDCLILPDAWSVISDVTQSGFPPPVQ